ncbi:MAG: 4Fe-4S binding protein [Proteobacteria bacterium]|nr:4Fe-4S binding protein [Pseudomonadota bacterium]
MSDTVYKKLAKVLDTLPNGYPSTDSGVEIKILEMIFRPEDAEIFCDLRLTFETPDQIAARSGRSLEGLNEKLVSMWHRGLIFGVDFGTVKMFKMVPWVFGIYEFQLKFMTREFAELCEEYAVHYGPQFFDTKPQLMQVVPIEEEISVENAQMTLPYERVSGLIEKGQAFAVNDCICKKEKELLGNRCDKPMEVCLAIAPVPGIFDDHPLGARPISKEEAYEVLRKSEEAGLVHMTSNFQHGHIYICNCCGCCCGVLRAINELGIDAPNVVNTHYYATIDTEECVSCGLCKDERCQVNAIEEKDDAYEIIMNKCIGCGVCISTCPSNAITLVRKNPEDIVTPPKSETEWFKIRGGMRGVDFKPYE